LIFIPLLSKKNQLGFQEKAMHRSELIEKLRTEVGLPIREAEEAVNLIFGLITDSLAKGERVEIRGFGSFKVKHYEGYQGRNPKTGEVLNVKPKKKPFFKCGKGLKERVNFS
jgi:integration host factor subunit beta